MSFRRTGGLMWSGEEKSYEPCKVCETLVKDFSSPPPTTATGSSK